MSITQYKSNDGKIVQDTISTSIVTSQFNAPIIVTAKLFSEALTTETIQSSIHNSKDITVDNLLVEKTFIVQKDIVSNGSLIASNQLIAGSDIISNKRLVATEDIQTKSNLIVDKTIYTKQSISAEQDIVAKGSISANGSINASGSINAKQHVNVAQNLNVLQNVNVDGLINVKQNLNLLGEAKIVQNTTIGGSINVNKDITTNGSIMVKQNINIEGAIASNGNIYSTKGLFIDGTGIISGNLITNNNLTVYGDSNVSGTSIVGESITTPQVIIKNLLNSKDVSVNVSPDMKNSYSIFLPSTLPISNDYLLSMSAGGVINHTKSSSDFSPNTIVKRNNLGNVSATALVFQSENTSETTSIAAHPDSFQTSYILPQAPGSTNQVLAISNSNGTQLSWNDCVSSLRAGTGIILSSKNSSGNRSFGEVNISVGLTGLNFIEVTSNNNNQYQINLKTTSPAGTLLISDGSKMIELPPPQTPELHYLQCYNNVISWIPQLYPITMLYLKSNNTQTTDIPLQFNSIQWLLKPNIAQNLIHRHVFPPNNGRLNFDDSTSTIHITRPGIYELEFSFKNAKYATAYRFYKGGFPDNVEPPYYQVYRLNLGEPVSNSGQLLTTETTASMFTTLQELAFSSEYHPESLSGVSESYMKKVFEITQNDIDVGRGEIHCVAYLYYYGDLNIFDTSSANFSSGLGPFSYELKITHLGS